MRIPYVDGQTGVAMKHYNNTRVARERMPGRREGQVLGKAEKFSMWSTVWTHFSFFIEICQQI